MHKLKKLWQNKLFKNYFIFFISFLMLEIIFRTISNLSIVSYSMLRIIIGLNILALILGFISQFIPKIGNKIFNLLLLLIFTIYGIAELGFKNYLGVYASIQSSSQAEAVTSYFFEYLKSFHWEYYLMLIPFVLVLIYYIFFDKLVSYELPKKLKTKNYYSIKCIEALMFVVLILIYVSTLKLDFMQDKTLTTSTYNIFLKPTSPSIVVSNFGYIEFGILDIKEYFLPGEEIATQIEYDPSKIGANHETENKELVSIDNVKWKNIIEKETNETLNTLNKYFISNKVSYSNEHSELFKDKNLIMIMVESGSNLMLNEEYYPNISKLAHDGWNFTNYYSGRNTCSTINNEFSGLTGLYTINNNCTAEEYQNNTYFESIFNLFNESGYNTASFHDYTEKYYPRYTIHTNMGSNDYYGVERLNIPYGTTYGDWPSDVDFISSYLNLLDERDTSKPFMNLLTTVTSHQPYTDNSTYNNLYKDLYPTEYPEDVRSYMSKLKVVDEAIGLLITGLEERDLLNDTVIVLYADHYPYGINQEDLSVAYGYDATIDKVAENVPFIIYNPEIESIVIEKYTAHVNTTPTLANLFGLKHDSRLYLGSDVLSEDYESIVIFDDASWKNEIAFFDASTSSITYYTQKVYTNEEILDINEFVSLKLDMSSKAIKNNYFKYLETKLNSYVLLSEITDIYANSNMSKQT